MEYFISGLWGFMELVFFHFFWGAFLYPKKSLKRQIITMGFAWVLGVICLCFVPNQIVKKLLIYFLTFLVSLYLYHGVWYQHIIFVAVGCIMNGLLDTFMVYGISALLGVSYTEFVWMKLYYVVTVSMSKLISILLAWTIRRLRKPVGNHVIQHKWLLLTLLFPVVSLAMLAVVFIGFQDDQDLSAGAVIFSSFLAAANIAIIYLIGMMEKSTREAQENVLLRQQMDIQTDSIIALERSYRDQRQATHEHKNQLQTIYDLLANGNVTDAREYIQQLQVMQTARIFAVNSHHPIVDAVLNHKYQTAKDHNIDFQIQLNDLSQINIGTDELVVLLSNLLDNAIEACCRVPKYRTIQCNVLSEGSLFISVRNTSNPVLIVDNTIPTSKTPKEEHGFGLPRIQLILKQLHAEYTFAYENGWFEFAAEIPPITK